MSDICCFTGYRPYRFGFSADGLRPEQVQKALAEQIARLYDEGCRIFISGMCTGVDLWAASEVLKLREKHPEAQLWAAIPFEGQEGHWSHPWQMEYRRVRAACQRVEVLFTPTEAAADAAACYRRRNRWMVDCADTVLAVCRVDVGDQRSGTAATVRYARQKQKRILYIHPSTLEVAEETVQQLEFSL